MSSENVRKHVLEGDEIQPITNATWAIIRDKLGTINPEGPAYFVLTNAKGDYLQVAGGPHQATMEVRQHGNGPFKHSVLGRRPIDVAPLVLECTCGPIRICASEAFALSEVVEVFRRFYEGEPFESDFILRDVTSEFS